MTDKYEPVRRILEQAEKTSSNAQWIRTGTVSKVSAGTRKIRVKLLPDGIETPWLRVLHLNSGEGYASGQLPQIDQEVVVLFLQGNIAGGFALMGSFIDADDEVDALTEDYELNWMDKNGNYIRCTSTSMKLNAVTKLEIEAPEIIYNSGTVGILRPQDVQPSSLINPLGYTSIKVPAI